MRKAAPEGSRGGLGLYDVACFEDQERVFDAAMQTSVRGEEEQGLDQKRAEISFRGDRQRTKMVFFNQIWLRKGWEG